MYIYIYKRKSRRDQNLYLGTSDTSSLDGITFKVKEVRWKTRGKEKKKELDEGPTWRMVDGGDTSFETRIRGGKNNIGEKAELGKNGVEK